MYTHLVLSYGTANFASAKKTFHSHIIIIYQIDKACKPLPTTQLTVPLSLRPSILCIYLLRSSISQSPAVKENSIGHTQIIISHDFKRIPAEYIYFYSPFNSLKYIFAANLIDTLKKITSFILAFLSIITSKHYSTVSYVYHLS